MLVELVCAAIALFCLVALGAGPAAFFLIGVLMAVSSFRHRRRRWWGLPLAAGGLALALAILDGAGILGSALALLLTIAAVTGLRSLTYRSARSGSSGRRAGGVPSTSIYR